MAKERAKRKKKCLSNLGLKSLDNRSKESILQAKDSRVIKSVDIDIVITPRNGDIKLKQAIRIKNEPTTRISKWNQTSQFR